jgi:two-component system sensor histidine kinase/response regulator
MPPLLTMYLSIDQLSRGDEDKRLYRILFLLICCVNFALHFLNTGYDAKSFDPLWLRYISSFVCLIAVVVSFQNNQKFYYVTAYFALVLFLAVNNGILLGLNNFALQYFYASLAVLLTLSFYCKRLYEVIILCALNICAFVYAFFIMRKDADVLMPLINMLLFTGIAFLFYYFRRSYFFEYVKINRQILDKNEALMRAVEKLEAKASGNQFADAAICNLTFEFDETGLCTKVWHKNAPQLNFPVGNFEGKLVYDLDVDELSQYFKKLNKNSSPVSFEAQSLFGNNRWYKVTVNPVFNNNRFTGNVFVAFIDIHDLKSLANTLKETELVLYNEQAVAKIGSWWNDVVTKDVTWSNNLYSILEISNIPEGRNKLSYYTSLIHPDDRAEAQVFFARASSSLSEHEHRLITPKGNLKYLKVINGYPIADTNGNTVKTAGIIQDVTESRTAENTIKIKQAQLIEVQSLAKVGGLTWDVTHHELTLSDEIYRMYERTADEEDQDNFKLLLSIVHPDDFDVLNDCFSQYRKTKQCNIEYRIITGSGKLKHINLVLDQETVKNGDTVMVVGTMQDISDRKRIKIDFEQSENKYKNVLEKIGLAAVTLDASGTVIFCNNYLAKMLSADKTQILDTGWVNKFVAEEERAKYTAWLESGSFLPHHTATIIGENGVQYLMDWKNTMSYDDQGWVKEITSIGEDITEASRLQKDLTLAKESAEKSSKNKSELLSFIGAELETPMNTLLGTTHLLLQDNPMPNQLERLNTLQNSGNNLMEMLSEIVDYNKIESGKLELHKLPFDLHSLAEQIVKNLEKKAAANNTIIELSADSDIPKRLVGDQLRLNQILNKLTSNAVKFTRNGTVQVILKTEHSEDEHVVIKFTVSDTGAGIPNEDLEKIFEPALDYSANGHREFENRRLSLALTKQLIELYNSNIHLDSQPGKGTSFNFTILFDRASEEVAVPVPLPNQPTIELAEQQDLTGMNILVVDDNKMNLMIAAKFLKNWQAIVTQASDGKEAVDKALHHTYDLIIMDLQMPVMDGFEASTIIKRTQPGLPIIALTADILPETNDKAMKAGMDDFLTKPFVPAVLYAKIRRYYKTQTV